MGCGRYFLGAASVPPPPLARRGGSAARRPESSPKWTEFHDAEL
jgi:hypothetical protein